MQKGYYLNDYEEGISWWENTSQENDSIILTLKSKPVIGPNGQKLYRKRLFLKEDIGKKIFESKVEAARSHEKV